MDRLIAAQREGLRDNIPDFRPGDTLKVMVKVKEGDKDVVYYLDEKSGKANHKAICTEAKKAKVTGTVKKDGDKQILTATKVEIE